MNKGGYFLDFSDFNKKFSKIVEKTIPEAAEKGMFNAVNQLLDDAVEKPPQAPFEHSDLWGSKSGEPGQPPVEVERKTNEITGIGGFNISYAAKQHEAEPGRYRYTRTGAKQPGPKFLESKMAKYREDYLKIIAKTIRNAK